MHAKPDRPRALGAAIVTLRRGAAAGDAAWMHHACRASSVTPFPSPQAFVERRNGQLLGQDVSWALFWTFMVGGGVLKVAPHCLLCCLCAACGPSVCRLRVIDKAVWFGAQGSGMLSAAAKPALPAVLPARPSLLSHTLLPLAHALCLHIHAVGQERGAQGQP